jgi:indolepyruvate ferredoxin oxidoreductase beta subunit
LNKPVLNARMATTKPLSVVVMAMGGQGGGVLTDWIVAVAEAKGWHAQSTSVPGVAQRTGATLYYIEMLAPRDGVPPILSLMPAPGDVDIVLAAEWMESGRSILRGLVTPDKTTLIASTHRTFAVAEKEKPGNGIANSGVVAEAAGFAAKRTIAFDMEALAKAEGSVISAPLFGALAGASVLPFRKADFEAVIAAGGKGIEPSLQAFRAGFDAATQGLTVPSPDKPIKPALRAANPQAQALLDRIAKDFPAPAQDMLAHGVKRVTEFQDVAYAHLYLDRVQELQKLDRQDRGFELTIRAAKYLAAAMAYDDVISVAEMKTRASRFERVRNEIGAKQTEILYATEFMHPRAQEIVGLMPARLGEWVEEHPAVFRAINKLFSKGRRVQTFKIGWFLVLYTLAAMKRRRRGTLRHKREEHHLNAWFNAAKAQAANYDLALEILHARRLVKGYADTHARGLSKFDRVMAAVPLLEKRQDGGEWLARLIAAALQDEDGKALDQALQTIRSFT